MYLIIIRLKYMTYMNIYSILIFNVTLIEYAILLYAHIRVEFSYCIKY